MQNTDNQNLKTTRYTRKENDILYNHNTLSLDQSHNSNGFAEVRNFHQIFFDNEREREMMSSKSYRNFLHYFKMINCCVCCVHG
jgi:hypothetical protein